MDQFTIRWSTEKDREKILACVGMGFSIQPEQSNKRMEKATTRLLSGSYPLAGSSDFCVVEDTSLPEKPIVSCACLMNDWWEYEGISFPVGRVEAVATHPNYQRRGLMRKVFHELHKESVERGHLFQAIVGIPYFYHNLGYTYGLRLHEQMIVPAPKTREESSIVCRKANLTDVNFLEDVFFLQHYQGPVFAPFSKNQWMYYIEEEGDHVRQPVLLERNGRRIGFFLTASMRGWKRLDISALAISRRSEWFTLFPEVQKAIEAYVLDIPTKPGCAPFEELSYALGPDHPVYTLLDGKKKTDEAWYIRIPDNKQFLKKIERALTMRLARSSYFCDHTGELRINLYTGGLLLRFDEGNIVGIEDWNISDYTNDSDFEIPEKDFWQLLMGYRSVDFLLENNPDVMVSSPAKELVDTLFPQKHSFVLPYEFK